MAHSSTVSLADIPAVEESVETLEFIGFTPETANIIFQNYVSRPDPDRCPDSILDYATGWAAMLNLPRFSDLTPREALTRVGLTKKLQDALLDPSFNDILWTESLSFWVRDTFYTNYNTLLQLQQRLENQAGRARIHGVLPGSTTAEKGGPLLPDHLILYKGRAAAYDMLYSEWIREDGSVNMPAMASHCGRDFNHANTAWYWTPEKDVAEEYRKWAERRSPFAETWLIQIQIPNSFVNSLTIAELWYGRDWKEYVWYCKNSRTPPAKYDQLWQHGRADLVRGHICTGVSAQIPRIKQGEVQTRITEDHVIMSSSTNRKATQYVFVQVDSATRLGEVIRGKIHIDISGAARRALRC